MGMFHFFNTVTTVFTLNYQQYYWVTLVMWPKKSLCYEQILVCLRIRATTMEKFNMTRQIRWGTLHSVPHGVRYRWRTRLSASMVPPPMSMTICLSLSSSAVCVWINCNQQRLHIYSNKKNIYKTSGKVFWAMLSKIQNTAKSILSKVQILDCQSILNTRTKYYIII